MTGDLVFDDLTSVDLEIGILEEYVVGDWVILTDDPFLWCTTSVHPLPLRVLDFFQ